MEMHLFDFIRRMRDPAIRVPVSHTSESFVRGLKTKPQQVFRFKPSKVSSASVRAREILERLNLR